MKVYCPSNGLCGLDHVDLPQVKIDMLRSVPDLPQDDVNRKNSFLAMLVGDKEFLKQITPEDRDYFFVISAASISGNELPFSVVCSCGEELRDSMHLEECDFTRLKRNQKRKVTKNVFGVDYTFNYLSAQDEAEVEDYAMDAPDEHYFDSKMDAIVAVTLFGSLGKESIEKALQVDLAIYMQALLFQRCYPHGITLKKHVLCSNEKCGKILSVSLPITGNILDVDVSSLLSNYVWLTKELSIEGFFSLSMPEYNAFVTAVNEKLRSKKSR